MTDYDDVRFCCSGSAICNDCWPLMQFALRILDRALDGYYRIRAFIPSESYIKHVLNCKEDFGFEHRLWVYSGRRGVHCWVADESARKLTSQARSSIAEYFTVIKGGDSTAKKVNLSYNMHPSLRRAAKIVHKGFEDYACNKQNFLGDDAKVTKFLTLIPTEYKFKFLI